MIKTLIRAMLRRRNSELIRYHPNELQIQNAHPEFGIRDISALLALGTPGQISIAEGSFLGYLVRSLQSHGPIIEIGTLFGYSTRIIAMNKSPERPLITVDNYTWNPLHISQRAHEAATLLTLGDAVARQSTQVLNMNKSTFYARYSGPAPSLFFCDADHSYEATKEDLEWAQSVGAETVCGDDYDAMRHPGVVRAVDELGGPATLVDGLFVLRSKE
jgi:predicted O-methyltransferase YrrM